MPGFACREALFGKRGRIDNLCEERDKLFLLISCHTITSDLPGLSSHEHQAIDNFSRDGSGYH